MAEQLEVAKRYFWESNSKSELEEVSRKQIKVERGVVCLVCVKRKRGLCRTKGFNIVTHKFSQSFACNAERKRKSSWFLSHDLKESRLEGENSFWNLWTS